MAHASGDGRYIVSVDPGQSRIVYLDLESDASLETFLEGPTTLGTPRFSPDSQMLAYVSNDELYVQRFPSGGNLQQVSTNGAILPRWTPDGSELIYIEGRDLMAVPVSAGESYEFGEPEKLFTLTAPDIYEYAVTRDGHFIVAEPVEETSTIAVVDNWQSFFETEND